MSNDKSYHGLAISSGGYKGIQFAGALVPLELNGYLASVRSYAGCSVGSVICLLLAVGWKPIEMARKAINVKLFNGLGDVDINEFKTNFGIMSNQSLRDELENLVLDKRKTLPTLLDLHNEGIYIAFSICDRRTKTGHKIDYKSHPTLLATEGALMSSNIPFVFPPIEFEGMKVIDGALCNPFPVDYLDNGVDKVLGLVVYGESNNDEVSFVAYTTGTIMIQIEEMQRVITKHASKACDILEVFVGDDVSVLDTNCAYSGKLQMFLNGIEDGKLFIKALHKRERRAKRRNGLNDNSKTNKNKKEDLYEKIARNNTPIRNFPDNLLVKCLMSQPIDILCQAAMTSNKIINEVRMNSIADVLTMLPPIRLERLKAFARIIIRDELDKLKDEYDPTSHIKIRPKNEFVNTSPRSRANSRKNNSAQNSDRKEDGKTVNIKENYSQKFYDSLPSQFKGLAKSVIDAIGEEKANTTILGINIILEGLNRLGINPLEGGFLTEPTTSDGFYNYDENDHLRNDNNPRKKDNKNNQSRVEIIPEEEEDIQEALNETNVVINMTEEEKERQRIKNPTDAID